MNLDILNKPIQYDEIDWKFITTTTKSTQFAPYVKARVVMQRFDDQFGAMNWSPVYREINNGFICRISVRYFDSDSNQWVEISKEDGASKTDYEAEKGGISNALKRTATVFGLGRDLYYYPKVYIAGEHKRLPDWSFEKLKDLVNLMNAQGFDNDFVFLKQDSNLPKPKSTTTTQEDVKPFLKRYKDENMTIEYPKWCKVVNRISSGELKIIKVLEHYQLTQKNMQYLLELEKKSLTQ